jgi:hypothetical protein
VQVDQAAGQEAPLDRLILHEAQLTRLVLGDRLDKRFVGEKDATLRSLASLTALRHLDARVTQRLRPVDCLAVTKLQHLTTLELPRNGRVGCCCCTSCHAARAAACNVSVLSATLDLQTGLPLTHSDQGCLHIHLLHGRDVM